MGLGQFGAMRSAHDLVNPNDFIHQPRFLENLVKEQANKAETRQSQ